MEHLAVEVPDVFTAGCEYILKKLGYEQCEENGMWGYLSKTTADSDDDNFDARFDKIVPYVCKENHPDHNPERISKRNLMSNTSRMASVQDVLKCLHEHGVQGNTARMEVVNMLDHKQVNTNYWYSPESIAKQLNGNITLCLTCLCGEVPEHKKATLSKLKFELNKAEDRVVIYLADEAIGHIFWCNDMYTLCWEAYNTKNPEQQFESWHFSGHFELATLMKKITAVVEAISNGDWKVSSVGETDEYDINSREEYVAAIAKIKAHFDGEDRCGEYDIASSV